MFSLYSNFLFQNHTCHNKKQTRPKVDDKFIQNTPYGWWKQRGYECMVYIYLSRVPVLKSTNPIRITSQS